MYKGHLPRLARLIRQDRTFMKKIRRVHVDEAHNIYTAGLPHHGEDAFRPAYGRLSEFRAVLPAGIPFQALSATFPPHIYNTVQRELAMSSNLVSIRLSTNRPNIMYATTPIFGTLHDFRNFNFLIPTNLHPLMDIPKALVFHDSKLDDTGAAQYTNLRLPKELRNQGIVRHYHGDKRRDEMLQLHIGLTLGSGNCDDKQRLMAEGGSSVKE